LPANSGAIAGTVAHKHSAPSGDGGDLSEGITNFTGGNVGEVLTATATDTPVWAAAGSSSLWTADGFDSGDKAALNVSGMTGRDITHIFYQVEPSTISTTAYPRMRVNSQNVNYDCCLMNQYVTGATDLEWNQTATGFFLGHEDGHTSEYQYIGDIYLYKGISTQESTGMFMTLRGLTYRNDSSQMSYIIYGGGYQPDTNPITDISFTMSSGNISGKIQVNSMNYQ
tara:strand:+ start:804 stop:1481 length:678 start_codon:yes stop_codon:yes gene_type:complete